MVGRHPLALKGRCEVDIDVGKGVRFVHVDPPVLVVDDLLTQRECDEVLRLTTAQLPPDAGRVIRIASQSNTAGNNHRVSTTWYVRYGCAAVAPLLDAVMALLPRVALERIEEVQLVRYAGEGQGFKWHEDALEEQHLTPDCGGQRVATCLIYLDQDCDDGGGGRTVFRHLIGNDGKRLAVSPKVGRALLFFPAVTGETMSSEVAFGERLFDDTRRDQRTVHAGEPPGGKGLGQRTKHIAQLWIHSTEHTPVVFGRGLNKHEEKYNKPER